MKFILGKKIEMSQQFEGNGDLTPVTIVEAGHCVVTQIKTAEQDGYNAIQVGFGLKKKMNNPQKGHLKDMENFRYLREFRVKEVGDYKKGQRLDVSSFNVNDRVEITGVTKGKGFQGVVKRHGFHGSPASHGHTDQLRMPGSIGSKRIGPVQKGKRMAGRMGGEKLTIKNLKIAGVDAAGNLLMIRGAVPGARNSLVIVKAL